jgi:hypothetical protein
MKTTEGTTTVTVRAFQLVFYLAIVAILAFFNCLTLRAGEPEKDNADKAVTPDNNIAVSRDLAEEALEIEGWMLNFDEIYAAGIADEDLRLEGWMLHFNLLERMAYYPDVEEEPMEIEDWMINGFISNYTPVEEPEEELELEAWMFNFDLLEGPVCYAEAEDDELHIEDWMLRICCWEVREFLADSK